MDYRDPPSQTVEALLTWYEEHGRDLPWRHQTEPYPIWVSEIMLQQTRVETVLPYYARFLEKFPTVESLASAGTEEVLGVWSGLGYYRRARNLHQAAREIVEANCGFPRDLEGLRALPGVGTYTAAAVGSIAFGIAEPAIDGNIERVVGRFLGIEEDPRKGVARKAIAKTAKQLLAVDRPGDSNQALMELGATLCRPRRARCKECPLASGCQAWLSGRPEDFAQRRSRTNQQKVQRKLVVVRDSRKILLFRRAQDSERLAGMWELPWVDSETESSPESGLARRYGGQWQLGDRLGKVRHAITNRSFDVEVVAGKRAATPGVGEGTEAGWFDREEIEVLAVSSLVKKALAQAPR